MVSTPHPDSQNPDGAAQSSLPAAERMLSYEVHFFRADGTLSLRLLTAAAGSEDVVRSLVKMQSREFAAVKVWRGLDRMVVRHKPAISEPETGDNEPSR